jgi:mono/diheme cytochrome c family protein
MRVRYALLLGVLLLFVPSSRADDKPTVDQSQFPPTYVPSGEHLYRQFCAACHGADAKGHGPAADSLKRPPADLTTLAQRHGGKFPYDYVSNLLLFGPGITAHGSAAMPTWGPIFLYLDKHNEAAAQQRIKNLRNYLASLQVDQRPPEREPVSTH